ncbi:condensation domain-containing protein [Dictyobacter kobayashii]|uniref:Condensation domain-containing protein n=1 Tax=Dictyobacter kobayashii TaxID=2014872 RepID=A0A402AVC8_9CHLR|nr:condensation domain-containing protein [Dictyobacter kobayashii]GCE23091.1 hypothetical protein KDK_68910 [Dictyobacter kobayashii]
MEQTVELSLQQKRELLSQLLQQKAGRQKKSFPLSLAQQRLWFLEQWHPNSSLYNIFGGIQISGPLSIDVLEQSFNQLLQRHETLRTHFVVEDDQVKQVVATRSEVALTLVDLSEVPQPEQEKWFHYLAMREARLPFDLLQGPLFRAKVVSLAQNEAILLLTMHHIISDGSSMDLFMRELAELYDAALTARPFQLAELPFQYRHYVSWQQRWVKGPHLEEHMVYWKQQLEQAATLQLPTDYARPGAQSFKGAREHLLLSAELNTALKKLSRQEGVTMFITLLAAFSLLLSRYAQQEDIVLGSPIASRTRSEFEHIIGFFVNMLVLRIDTTGNPTFRDLLQRTRQVALDAYTHQEVPFERLVEELAPERDVSRNPLFQVMFAFQSTSLAQFQLAGTQVKPLRFDMGHSRFDLSLNTWEEQDEIVCLAEYSTDLFSGQTIALMLRHFANLLEEIVRQPDQRISTFSLLDEQERQELLYKRNSNGNTFVMEHTVVQRVEREAALRPTAVALRSSSGELSYHELNSQANQLAHFLQRKGVGPEVMVAYVWSVH